MKNPSCCFSEEDGFSQSLRRGREEEQKGGRAGWGVGVTAYGFSAPWTAPVTWIGTQAR